LVRCMPACCSKPSSSGSSFSTTSMSQNEPAAAGRPVGYFTAQPTTPHGVRSTSSSAAPAVASYPHLGQERINADGSLSTAYTRYRQQQQQQVQAPHSASTSGSSPASNQQVSTATGSSPSSHSSSSSAAEQQAPRPPGLPAAAPAAVPASRQQLDQLADLIQSSRRVVVITGAGCSTESNIPDYRGPGGAYTTGKCLCRRCCWHAVACCGCDAAGVPQSQLTWLPTKHAYGLVWHSFLLQAELHHQPG
jgi:hypothetical protein